MDPGPGTADSLKHCPPPDGVTYPCLGPADSLKHCPPPSRSRIRVPDRGQPQALPPRPAGSQIRVLGQRTASNTAPRPPGRRSGSRTADSLKRCPPPSRVTDLVPDRGQPCLLLPAFSMQISRHLVASGWGSPLGCLASLGEGLRAVFRLPAPPSGWGSPLGCLASLDEGMMAVCSWSHPLQGGGPHWGAWPVWVRG
uniref:Uncharacterized protein n=1 Tax=Myotis myotis TaxID=51298 RepID=A0A7J7Z4S6_MYOMY|nr:hypothetical protein mMyoMyo1_010552 [Myotis myotis]